MANAQPEVKVRNPQFVEGGLEGTYKLQEAAGQSFKAGEPVKLVAGLVTVCANDDAALYGFAMQDASGVTNADIWVKTITPESRLIFSLYDGVTTGDNGAVAGTLATYIGGVYPMCKVAIAGNYGLGKWVLSVKAADKTQSTLNFKIEGITDKDSNRTKKGSFVVARMVVA